MGGSVQLQERQSLMGNSFPLMLNITGPGLLKKQHDSDTRYSELRDFKIQMVFLLCGDLQRP